MYGTTRTMEAQLDRKGFEERNHIWWFLCESRRSTDTSALGISSLQARFRSRCTDCTRERCILLSKVSARIAEEEITRNSSISGVLNLIIYDDVCAYYMRIVLFYFKLNDVSNSTKVLYTCDFKFKWTFRFFGFSRKYLFFLRRRREWVKRRGAT